MPKGEPISAEALEERYAGTGLGNKKFSQLVKELNLDPVLARQRLAAKGIKMADNETLKNTAAEHDTDPFSLLKIMVDAK